MYEEYVEDKISGSGVPSLKSRRDGTLLAASTLILISHEKKSQLGPFNSENLTNHLFSELSPVVSFFSMRLHVNPIPLPPFSEILISSILILYR